MGGIGARAARRGARLTAPIPIAYVTDTWPLGGGGGAERALFTLVTGIDRHRFRPFVVAAAGDGSSEYLRLAREAGVPAAVLGASLSEGLPTAGFNIARLVGLLRHHRTLIVHSSQDQGVGVLAGLLAGVPVRVYTTHRMHGPQRFRRQMGERVVMRRIASRNVAVSHAVARNLRLRFGVDPSRVEVVFNGVRFDDASSSAEPDTLKGNPGASDPRIVSVGRLVREKGVDILLKAMVHVVASEIRARLTVVGDGPERASLEQLSVGLGLGRHVRFVGHQIDVAKWLAGASVLAMPSRSEGMGIAAVEALASAIPVVCSNAGGLPEVVDTGHCGIVVEGSEAGTDVEVEPQSFATALLHVVRDHALAQQFGANGRRRYETHFTANEYVGRHEELYLQELRRIGGLG